MFDKIESGSIRLNCFVRGETVNKNFWCNNLTVDDLGNEIRRIRQDLQEIDFDLYKKNFFQENDATVNTTEERKGN